MAFYKNMFFDMIVLSDTGLRDIQSCLYQVRFQGIKTHAQQPKRKPKYCKNLACASLSWLSFIADSVGIDFNPNTPIKYSQLPVSQTLISKSSPLS